MLSKSRPIETFSLTMFDYQLEAILQHAFGRGLEGRAPFHGVFARDTVPLTRKDGGYIINFDRESEPGSHWVAVYITDDLVKYFDSSGQPPLHCEIEFFLGPKYHYNSVHLQPVLSKCCGQYCIYYLVQRHVMKRSSQDIISVLKRSDSLFIVKNFVTRYYSSLL